MKKLTVRYIIFLAFLLGNLSYAQVDTLSAKGALREVEIIDLRLGLLARMAERYAMDSVSMGMQNVAEALVQHSSVFVKDYGPGQPSTVSLKGSTAQQVSVLWNHLPLSSARLGLVDFSLLPLFLFDELLVDRSGSGAGAGGGAIGGSVVLSSHLSSPGQQQWSAGAQWGSFGQQTLFAKTYLSGRKWHGSIRLGRQLAENNFLFADPFSPNGPRRRMSHAGFEQDAAMAQFQISLRPRHQLSTGLWWQAYFREIPPTSLESFSEATLSENAMRAYLNYSGHRGPWSWNVHSGVSNEQTAYSNPQLPPEPQVRALLLNIDADVNFTSANKQWKSSYGVLLQRQQTEVEGQQIFRRGLFSGLIYQPKAKVEYRLWLRQEIFQDRWAPLMPELSMARPVGKSPLLWLIKWARVFRYPTLNDLYWPGQGNPLLLPEKGHSAEAGLKWDGKHKLMRGAAQMQAFYSIINDFIQWLPVQGLWQPVNQREVLQRGAWLELKGDYTLRKWVVGTRLQGQWVRSTERYSSQQLIYVPEWTGLAGLTLSRKRFQCLLSYQYTGERFISETQGASLSPFALLNLQASNGWTFGKYLLNAFVRCNNLLNTSYEVMAYRPMPGIQLSGGITLQWNAKIQYKP